MKTYHPLDTRYRPDADATATDSRPWKTAGTDPQREPWQAEGPIREDDRQERKAREQMARQAEAEAKASVGWMRYVFGPAQSWAGIKGFVASEKALKSSPLMTVFKIVAAFALYFGLMHLDGIFGINDFLTQIGTR